MGETPFYHEVLRPRFHFTARTNWLNDPNGLVYSQGEYHLFFQHNTGGITWGPMSWGHAVSTDLVHWEQLAVALSPMDERDHFWSGSAVVDRHNTAGLGDGATPPLIACYTSVDGSETRSRPAAQCIASSTDRGRTWRRFQGNPVLPHVEGANRDPKIIWHEPTGSWIMALYLDRSDFALFRSTDLRAWSRVDSVEVPGSSECPDFFPLLVDGDPRRETWVFWVADGRYLLGSFDGRHFAPTAGPFGAEQGPNGYAAQTWSDLPASDGRRVQISWMRGGTYPYMPFNQQLSFPLELTLRDGPGGVRLCRTPVREIESLWRGVRRWENRAIPAHGALVPEVHGSTFDIHAVFEVPPPAVAVSVRIHGNELRYDPARGSFTFLGREVPAPPRDGTVTVRLLVDRTSLELFADEGRTAASFCFLPAAWDRPLEITAEGGEARARSLEVREIASAWPEAVMEG